MSSLKKHRPKIYLVSAYCLAASLISCDSHGFEMGDNWVNESTRTIVIDTCTVQLSTVMLDSLPTSGGSHIFVGSYRDEYFGSSTAASYLTFDCVDSFGYDDNIDNKRKIRFDSLTVMMTYDSLYYGDTTQLMTLRLHRLKEQVELDDNGYLYGHSSFAYDPVPIASKSFRPKPTSKRTIEIRMPDELGREFLDKLQEGDEIMTNTEKFVKYFNGLVVTADESSKAIIGFKSGDSTRMRLYYHIIAENREDYTADFTQDQSLQFTRMTHDRSGTPLQEISRNKKEIISAQTGNKAFIQGMAGLYTKIEFPHLNKIMELGAYGNIIGAMLYIYPVKGSYGGKTYAPLPDSVVMYVSNELNVTTGAITNNNEELQIGNLNIDDNFNEDTYYEYDITEFIKDQLGKFGIYKSNLQMIVSDYGNSLNNIVIGNQNLGKNNVKLIIKYSIYDDK